jgi:peroxiredoxin
MAYGACESPEARSANRISYVIGPDGRVRAAWSKVSPATHPQEVLEIIEGSPGRPTVAG